MSVRDDLSAHRAALAACRRCNHPHDVVPIVSLARRPRVMLVGQAPGAVERTSGRPFSGRAGRTLFRWLELAGLDEQTARERIYIAAITRCYPGPSPSGRGDRVPSRVERDACAEWLDAELRLIRPKLIVPVGRLAIDRFLGPIPLEDVVGRTLRVNHPGGESDCIPLPHPSGASAWVHEAGHRRLLDKAVRRLRHAFQRIGLAAVTVGLLLICAIGTAGAQRRDPVFGPDKVKHFFLSAFVQSFSYSVFRATNLDHGSSLIGATTATTAVGVWKEVRDSRVRGEFSMKDLLWDVAGAGTATLFLIHSRR